MYSLLLCTHFSHQEGQRLMEFNTRHEVFSKLFPVPAMFLLAPGYSLKCPSCNPFQSSGYKKEGTCCITSPSTLELACGNENHGMQPDALSCETWKDFQAVAPCGLQQMFKSKMTQPSDLHWKSQFHKTTRIFRDEGTH